MQSSLVALDVAILLPPDTTTSVELLNEQLEAPPGGFRFDQRHLPHISLVQQFSPTESLSVRLYLVIRNTPASNLILSDHL